MCEPVSARKCFITLPSEAVNTGHYATDKSKCTHQSSLYSPYSNPSSPRTAPPGMDLRMDNGDPLADHLFCFLSPMIARSGRPADFFTPAGTIQRPSTLYIEREMSFLLDIEKLLSRLLMGQHYLTLSTIN